MRISGRVIRLPAAASDAVDSSSVMMIIARLPMPLPPYSSGHRHAEVAELAHRVEDRLGHEIVVAVDVLGERRDLLARELPCGVARHLGHVAVDVARC